ncbi:ABC transporter ATP-binding protein [Scytonema hofmannii PCC 7110]|uniref:ABC transporter ATP-binding protein n=1 Tax=Scytonema hofmannii PCC 7110 TaxID=128403 RepID=A0A139WYY1_9CYAN|nr:peptidase domain-containing ABC transporter [Scytonema hofmannii]KYC37655.1 ABC transporter ATP-binding protein [Scytonema hofmannii PCC 7110]
MLSEFSQQQLSQQLTVSLGETLSEEELQSCVEAVEIVEPQVAKQFWQATEAKKGIYIILSGKVRLLDSANDLITTQSAGASFGELTLFAEEGFQPYAARASTNLKLCYLKQEILQGLMSKYPKVREHLHRRAELWDLLLLCRQNLELTRDTSVEEILKVLSLFTRYSLETGLLPREFTQHSKLWLIQKGELQNSQGYSLIPGNIYGTHQIGKREVTQPTVVYILKDFNWQIALEYWQQLADFANCKQKENLVLVDESRINHPSQPKQESLPSSKNIIPFPLAHRESQQEQKQKKQRPYFPSPKVRAGQMWGRLTQRYPFYAQQSASDCGAACLVMIGRFWGKRFSVNRLRDLANVSRNGSTLRAMAAAAETIGFTTRPVKASLDKLAQQPLPAIAHWESKHYIVIYEITKRKVIVSDPAIGQRTLTSAQFKEGWTGYALLLQPTAILKEAFEETEGFWRFFELVKPHSWVLLEVFAASLLIQIFGLITPLFTQLLLDRVIVQGSTLTLNAVGLGLLIFGLFRIAMTGLRQYLLDHTANRISLALLVGFIKHTFRLPLSFFESRYVGDIISRVQENQKIQRFLTGEALSICLDLLTVFIYVGLMFWYSWQMALIALAIVPPFFLLAILATPWFRRINRDIFSAIASESSYLIQALTGIRSIRSMAIEQTVRWHWEEQLNHLFKKMFGGQVVTNQLQIFSSTIESLVTTGLLWFGAWLVIQNQLTIGQLIAFNMLLGNIILPFKRLTVLWNQLQEVIISTERINDVLEAEPEEDLHSSSRRVLRRLRGQVQFENVTFRYHPESDINVLENLSFEIQPEQTVAVVGRSGSGKTTLSKLILGLYPPTNGRVLIDGHDVMNISLKSLRQQIGVVDQDTFLFGGTIQENISIAHPEATMDEIIEAARLAGADEFIQHLAMGYETQIGEGGGMLSGGQRQRLAIARALLGNPRFIIFDEATSHLDTQSEQIIQNNLKDILKGRTSLIIAHRLSTVRSADLILVLDRGVLVESGTHNELIARKGHYFYLNQQQLAQTN